MKHYTCDKCGIRMEHPSQLTIGVYNYEICVSCYRKIMQKLEGRGSPCDTGRYEAFRDSLRD